MIWLGKCPEIETTRNKYAVSAGDNEDSLPWMRFICFRVQNNNLRVNICLLGGRLSIKRKKSQ